MSAGRLDVVIVSPETIAIDSAFVAVAPGVSVTRAVKFDVPAAVGVPVIAPVDVLRESPAGRLPEEIHHTYGVVPPVAAIVWL